MNVLRQGCETSGVWLLLATIVCLKKGRNIWSLFPVSLSFRPGSTGHSGSAQVTEEGNYGTSLPCSPAVRESRVKSVVFPIRREQLNPELAPGRPCDAPGSGTPDFSR